MPTDWSVATAKDKNGWVMPYIGQWKLLGYTNLDTATPKLTDSTITLADYRAQKLSSGGHGKLPGPYFGVHDNEAAIQNNDGVAYQKGGWYTNWNQRWSGKTFSATADDSGIYAIAHGGKPGAITFTAPVDGDYTYTETVEQLLFTAGGTTLQFEVTVRKNGEVINKFTPSSSNKSTTLTGTVTLEAGDILMFAFEQKTNVAFSSSQSEHKSNDPNCFKVTNVSVTQKNHVCSSSTLEKHSSAPDFCASGVTSYYSCYCGKLYKDASAKNILTVKDHSWKNGSCKDCGVACKHDVSASDADCYKAAVCGICGYEVAPITAGKHKDTNGTYRYIGDGKHQFNRTCCDSTDITSEACMYGNDNICDKCGNDKTKNPNETRLIGLGLQRPTRTIAVYNIAAGEMNDPIWSYTSSYCTTVSGFKFRNIAPYGDVVLIAGGTTAEMVSYDTKEVIWRTNKSPSNAHSIELLPNGIVAVAGSSGNAIAFFNINDNDPEEPELSINYTDAHGVLWDPKNEVLWCAGDDMLYAYKVTLNADGSITLVKDEKLSIKTPDGGLHDLQAYTGNADILIITTENHVYYFDKVKRTFTDVYTDVAGTQAHWIRAVGIFENGDFFYTEHDGGDDNGSGGGWNTTFVHYIDGETRTLTTIATNAGRFYKARVWSSAYLP
jgi:hypothetical protein